MKCAFVNLGKHFGGVENYLLTLVAKWIKEGNEGVIIAKSNTQFAKAVHEKLKNARIIEVDYKISDFIRVKKILKKEQIELIDINGINSAFFMYGINKNVKKITTVHSNAEMDRIDKSKFVRKLFLKIEKMCLKKSEKIIAVSEAIKNLLVCRGINADKISVIHNGVKKIDYPQENKKQDGTVRICFVGRLEKVKGCEYLLRALKIIKNNQDSFHCDIYGDGSLRTLLEEYVIKNEMNAQVSFKGFNNNIRTLLCKYDVIVLPSLYEAFPLTIPEAMNAKTLVVCSDVGGMSYIIKDKSNGFLFKKGDYTELAEILDSICNGKVNVKKITDIAYKEFEELYTVEVMTKNTFDFLYEV